MVKKLGNKKAQEEMFGFAIIIIVVAVVVLLFLYFSMNSDKESMDSYKSESFIQAILQYTTNCQKYQGEYMDIEDLIYSCAKEEECIEGNESCEVLNSTLTDMIDKSWPAGKERPTKGYEFLITSEEKDDPVFYFEKGSQANATVIKGNSQNLPQKSGTGKIELKFTVYERD